MVEKNKDTGISNYKNLLEIAKLQIYCLDNVSNNNCYVLLNLENNDLIKEINIFKVYDIMKDKNPYILFYIYIFNYYNSKGFVFDQALFNNGVYDENLLKSTKIDINMFLLQYHKEIYNLFKDFVTLVKINVRNYGFKPINDRIYIENGNKYLNLYFSCNNWYNLPAKANNDFKHIDFLLSNLFGDTKEHFYKFLAFKLQNPTETFMSHWIIQDKGGTGKTEILYYYILSRLFNTNIIGQKELDSDFNHFLSNSTMVICEEVEGYENEKRIKELTGSQEIFLNEKYKAQIKIRNYNNFIFFSNETKPIKISNHDRRFNVTGGGLRLQALSDGKWDKCLFKSRDENVKFFKEFHKNLDKELQNFYQNLLSIKVTKVEVQQNLDTTQKRELQDLNETTEISFLKELYELGFFAMVRDNYGGYNKKTFFDLNYTNIVEQDNTRYGHWLNPHSIYNLYFTYAKTKNGSKIPCSSKTFWAKLRESELYGEVFVGSQEYFSYNNKKLYAIKLKNPIDLKEL